MQFSLAWRNLVHDKPRMAVALGGMGFAVVLMFIQLGLYGSVLVTATLTWDRIPLDALIVSTEYQHLMLTGTIPDDHLARARGVPGVASVLPLYVGTRPWRSRDTRHESRILVLGLRPEDPVFDIPEVAAARDALRTLDAVLVDDRTRPDFGPIAPGVETECGGHHVRVAGQYPLGIGFGAFGALITSDATFSRLFGGAPLSRPSVGIVRVTPGADPDAVARALRALLPRDARVLTRAELEVNERAYWTSRTNVGILFGVGAVLAFVIGAIVLYQLLASEVLNHLPEFATLKAMGYRDSFLTRVVLETAAILGGVSFVPAFALSLGVYALIRATAHLPVAMTAARAVSVLVLTFAMALTAGLITVRKAKSADPAELF